MKPNRICASTARSSRDRRPVILHEQVSLVHVGMKEAVAHRVAQKGLEHSPGELGHVVPGLAQLVDAAHLDAVDPLHGENGLRGA
jgi:hypothetical protein